MNDIRDKINKLAYNYRSIFGIFPGEIGVHRSQASSFAELRIACIPPDSYKALWAGHQGERPQSSVHELGIHNIKIVPVEGWGYVPDEVYTVTPGQPDRAVSGTVIAQWAKEYEA